VSKTGRSQFVRKTFNFCRFFVSKDDGLCKKLLPKPLGGFLSDQKKELKGHVHRAFYSAEIKPLQKQADARQLTPTAGHPNSESTGATSQGGSSPQNRRLIRQDRNRRRFLTEQYAHPCSGDITHRQ
jgi:hypothetical protein